MWTVFVREWKCKSWMWINVLVNVNVHNVPEFFTISPTIHAPLSVGWNGTSSFNWQCRHVWFACQQRGGLCSVIKSLCVIACFAKQRCPVNGSVGFDLSRRESSLSFSSTAGFSRRRAEYNSFFRACLRDSTKWNARNTGVQDSGNANLASWKCGFHMAENSSVPFCIRENTEETASRIGLTLGRARI